MHPDRIGIDDILKAKERIASKIRMTPVVASLALEELCNMPVFIMNITRLPVVSN